jgi:hypothetical protein
MSNLGKRPQPSSGIPESVSSKRTSAAQAGAAPARNILPISALLNSSRRASSLLDQPELPLHASREAIGQRERTSMPQSSVSLDFQPGEGSGLPIRQFDFQSSLLTRFRRDGGADPISTTLNRMPSQEAGFRPSGDASSLSLESSPQPSGGDASLRTAFVSLNREQFGSDTVKGSGPSLARQLMPPPRPPVGFQPSGGAGLPISIPHILQPRVAVAIRPSGGAGSQLSRPSIPQLRAPISVQPSGETDPNLGMDFFPQPSTPERCMLNARPDPESGRATSSQPSQGDYGRKRMDYFRLRLLRDHFVYLHIVKLGQHILSNSRPDVTTVSGAAVHAQVQARTKFLISNAKTSSASLMKQFKTSYCPAIRESKVLTQPHHYYDPEICQVFKSHTDLRARLLFFEAKVQSLRRSIIDTNAKLQLYCQYVLVVDEERSELLDDVAYPNTHSQSSQTARDDLVGVTAQAHSGETGDTGDAQPTIPVATRTTQAKGSPSQTGRSHARVSSSTEAHAAQGSSSGISGTRDARPTSLVATRTAQADSSRVSSRGGHPAQTEPFRPRRDSPTEAATPSSSSEMGGSIPAASSNASEVSSRLQAIAARALIEMNSS